jgi:hypothetical protein
VQVHGGASIEQTHHGVVAQAFLEHAGVVPFTEVVACAQHGGGVANEVLDQHGDQVLHDGRPHRDTVGAPFERSRRDHGQAFADQQTHVGAGQLIAGGRNVGHQVAEDPPVERELERGAHGRVRRAQRQRGAHRARDLQGLEHDLVAAPGMSDQRGFRERKRAAFEPADVRPADAMGADSRHRSQPLGVRVGRLLEEEPCEGHAGLGDILPEKPARATIRRAERRGHES